MNLTEMRSRVMELKEELRTLTDKRVKEGLDEKEEKRFTELLDVCPNEEKTLRAYQLMQETPSPKDIASMRDCDAEFLEMVLRCKKDRRTDSFEVSFRGDPSAGGATPTTPTTPTPPIKGEDVKAITPDLFKGLLEPLRAKSVLQNAGARWETGVEGEPVWAGFGTIEASLVDEVEELKDTSFAFNEIRATPHRMGVTVPCSYRSISQSAYDLRSIVLNEMRMALDRRLNNWAFHVEDPSGLYTKATKNPFETLYPTTKLTYTTDITWKDLVGLETEVISKDIEGEGCYLMNPQEYQKLKYTPLVGDVYPAFMAGGAGFGNRLPNGMRVEVSNLVPKGVVLYGVFNNLAVTQFGNVIFVVDGYTRATKGQVCFTANTEFDITTLRPEAFAVLKKK